MKPRQELREAVRTLKPYRQGDIDALCGLYAIINAIQLALYPRRLRQGERDALFYTGLDELERRQLLRSTLSDGMYYTLWLRLCHSLVETASSMTGNLLTMLLPPPRSILTTDHAIRLLRLHLRRGRPVLLELHGRLNHWTVVVNVSDTRLTFFDSSGHRWVQLPSVGLVRGRAKPAHGIFTNGIIAIRRIRQMKGRDDVDAV